jgi:hypothetical protein
VVTKFNSFVKIAFTGLLLIFLIDASTTPAIASDTIIDLSEPALNLARSGEPITTPTPPETQNPLRYDIYSTNAEPVRIPILDGPIQTFVYPKAVLYDNGPLITHPGGGYNGADASALQTTSGMTINGFNHRFSGPYRMADDFEITNPGGWKIESITFFAYQTDAPTTPSTITGIYYQIWDGPPNNPESSIVWGDLTTNRLVTSTWSNIYRVAVNDLPAVNRPIMANSASAGVTLRPGVYWLDWTTDGSLTSGPWAPPISILGQTTTGNALQFYPASWTSALDAGSITPQGMPFIIQGVAYDFAVFLPMALDTYIPSPVLNAIDNLDGDGKYSVSWSLSEGASLYTLQEDDNAVFSSPTTVYSGSSNSKAITRRDVGTYYYRVRASGGSMESAWSNVESAVVTVPLPPCPQLGAWSGWTSQGEQIKFSVSVTPDCGVVSLEISYISHCENGGSTFEHEFLPNELIENMSFVTYSWGYFTRVSGTFTTLNSANGSWSSNFTDPVNGQCWSSGTWTAAP